MKSIGVCRAILRFAEDHEERGLTDPDLRTMNPNDEAISRQKQSLRAEIRHRRVVQPEKDLLSQAIWKRLAAMPEYERAHRVVLYIDCRNEVRTRPFLGDVWAAGKQVIVPYCEGEELGLFRLEGTDELEPGAMGILEPRRELRQDMDRTAHLEPGDFVIVPGVAFDRQGGRLGQGGGYYDRLLTNAPSGVVCAGIAFECQMVDAIPHLEHDVSVSRVVTEKAVYGV